MRLIYTLSVPCGDTRPGQEMLKLQPTNAMTRALIGAPPPQLALMGAPRHKYTLSLSLSLSVCVYIIYTIYVLLSGVSLPLYYICIGIHMHRYV